MNYDEFNHFCGSFTGASHVVQWGNSEVWKVGGKVFAIGGWSDGSQAAFTFKTSNLNFDFLSDSDGYKPAPYFASRGMKWIQQLDTSGKLNDDLKYYLSESYRIVASGLSKRKQQELGIDLLVDPKMTELNKMISGKVYDPSDELLSQMRSTARKITAKYNQTNRDQKSLRDTLLKQLFGSTGNEIKIEPNFNCDYGKNIKVGENFYMNFSCVILDCAKVDIGDNCFIGPQVGIYTACHPLDPIERNNGIEFAKPITIGHNCWIGGHATINPGVILGDNVVVASGSVVTKNFPNNVVIGGNPARVIKEI